MSLKDAKIRYLMQELDEKERRIQMMQDDVKAPGNPGAESDERIAALEKKVKEIEALVKGLTEELLDLKAIAMRLSRASEERRAELRRVQPGTQPAPGAQAPAGTVVMQKKTRPADAPSGQAAPSPQDEQGQMDLIMQPDGTMKMEKRRGDRQYIIATGNFRKGGGKGDARGKAKQDVIIAEDDEKGSGSKKKK
jgi:hypothetical protein